MTGPAEDAQPWQEAWFDSVRPRRLRAWRAVEAQHAVATMRLVDTLDEQAILEQVLERSKPPLPRTPSPKHYLLSTPFRYRPPYGSRFRRGGTHGVWYGGATVRTACAEVAYWRWRFLTESEGLREQELLTEHTVFAAEVTGPSMDLAEPPWSTARQAWTHPDDYQATQAVADAARRHSVAWLHYESVRDPGGRCCAVFDLEALSGPDLTSQQTWHCRTTRTMVRMVHGQDRYEWRLG